MTWMTSILLEKYVSTGVREYGSTGVREYGSTEVREYGKKERWRIVGLFVLTYFRTHVLSH